MFKRFKNEANIDATVEITIATRTVLRVLGLILAVFLLVLAVYATAHSLALLFTAFFLALALNAPVSFFARHMPGRLRGSRSVGTGVTFLIGILFVGGFLSLLVPPLIGQTQSFVNSLPGLVESVRDPSTPAGKFVDKYHLDEQVASISDDLGGRLKSYSGSAIKTLGAIGSSIIALLTVIVLTFMMLVEGPRFVEFFKELIPKAKRSHAVRVSADMYRVVKGFVNGQVTLAAIASVAIVPALFVFGVSYPLALVFVIFICGLIPMVGHTIGATIVTIVAAFTSSLPHALFVLAWYILYQQIENYTIQPKIQANSTDMSPLLVFASVVVGISFGGLAGGLFAIPVAGCARIIVLDFLISRSYIQPKDAPVIEATASAAEL